MHRLESLQVVILGIGVILGLKRAKACCAIENNVHLALNLLESSFLDAIRFLPGRQQLQAFFSISPGFGGRLRGPAISLDGRDQCQRLDVTGIVLKNQPADFFQLHHITRCLICRPGLLQCLLLHDCAGILLQKGHHGCRFLLGVLGIEGRDIGVILRRIFNLLSLTRLFLTCVSLQTPSVRNHLPLRRYCRGGEHQRYKNFIHGLLLHPTLPILRSGLIDRKLQLI